MKKLFVMMMLAALLMTCASAEELKPVTMYGFVTEIDAEENTLLISTESLGQIAVDGVYGTEVLVRLPEGIDATSFVSSWVIVEFNGVMTMSLPGQVNATAVTACHAQFGEVEALEDDQIALAIHFGEDLMEVLIDKDTPRPEGLKVGDTVRVFYNGVMTKSIPPQINALCVERAAKITTISIDGNPTTGFEWTAKVENTNVAALAEIEYRADMPADGIPVSGMGGTYFFTFRAVGAGETVVDFTNVRQWGDRETAGTAQYRLIVSDDLSIACEPVE